MRKKISLIMALCLALMLSGCGHELASYRPIGDVNDLEGRKIGVNMAWASDYVLSPRDGEDLILYRYDNTADMLMALFYHQIDAMCIDDMGWLTMEYTNGESLRKVEEPVATDGFVVAVSPSGEKLRNEFNSFLEYYHQTEEFADLYKRLSEFDGVQYAPGEHIHPNGDGEKIRLAFCGDYFPYCYIEPDGTVRGYDIEIMYAFADYFNYDIEFIDTSYADLTYGISTERYDMGLGTISMSYVPEIELTGVYATDVYYEVPLYLVELKEGAKLVMSDDFYWERDGSPIES